MPDLKGSPFERSVVYIFEHTNEGTVGLILNKPIPDSSIQMLFKQFDFSPYRLNQLMVAPVYCGGPVCENQGYILHSNIEEHEMTIKINDELMLTRSQDILKMIGTLEEPNYLQVFLGHTFWEPSQLESEIQNNDWLVVPATSDFIFNLKEYYPDEAWFKTAQLIQVDFNRLSSQYGRL